MAAKCTRLEKELEERSVDKLEGGEEEEGAGSGQVSCLQHVDKNNAFVVSQF